MMKSLKIQKIEMTNSRFSEKRKLYIKLNTIDSIKLYIKLNTIDSTKMHLTCLIHGPCKMVHL